MIKKRYSVSQLRSMAPSHLRAVIKEMQVELFRLNEEHDKLVSATQGYLLGIGQLQMHIRKVLKRTRQIQDMHTGNLIL